MISVREEILVKHNALTGAQYDMAATEQKIFCMLVHQIKQENLPGKLDHIDVKDLEEARRQRADAALS